MRWGLKRLLRKLRRADRHKNLKRLLRKLKRLQEWQHRQPSKSRPTQVRIWRGLKLKRSPSKPRMIYLTRREGRSESVDGTADISLQINFIFCWFPSNPCEDDSWY